ncbi:MAG: hypothetical protein ACYDAR_01780 [Thermomicrobiales bacterium]
MGDYMIGELARAMQDDWRAQAAKRALVAEAEAARRPRAHVARLSNRRAAIAKALMALAMRLAPSASPEAPHPGMATRATQ